MDHLEPGPLDGVRRWFHRRERPLILLWLALLLVLNLLPVAWLLANRAWGIEDKLVRGHRWYWKQRYRSALAAEAKDPARGLHEMEALLADLGPVQLRETTGRLRQDALLEIARLELGAGHPKRSLRAALEVSRTDPYDARGWVALGDAQWDRKKRKEAARSYEQALSMNPNLEHAVQRVMEHQTNHADWEGAVATFERYRNAVWSLPLHLEFTDSWPHFDPGRFIEIPVLADGKQHRWRVQPAHPRAVGSFVVRKMPSINGLRLSLPAAGAAVGVQLLKIEDRGFLRTDGALPRPPAPVLVTSELGNWEPGRGLEPLGKNRWLVRGKGFALKAPVSIAHPGDITLIAIGMTVSKPVGAGTARLLRWACHNLGHDHEIKRLLRPLVVIPEPDQGPNATPAPAGAGTGSTARPSGRPAASDSAGPAAKAPKGYSIAVAGHVRRGPKDDPPLLPALIAALPEISLRDRALVLTGDTVWEGTPARLERLDRLLRDPLGIPLFIAPGNHDLFDGRPGAARRRFAALFGPSWTIERMGETLLVVLDTEDPPGDIGPQQLRTVLKALRNARRSSQVRTVVVCMHRVLWFLGDPEYAVVARRANRSSQPGVPGNGDAHRFCTTLLPELEDLARTKPVAVIAGDVGTRIPLVYDRRGGVVLIASGNRAQDPPAWWNHYLRVHLAGGRIRVETVSLGTAPLGPVERYTPEFWRAHPEILEAPREAGP